MRLVHLVVNISQKVHLQPTQFWVTKTVRQRISSRRFWYHRGHSGLCDTVEPFSRYGTTFRLSDLSPQMTMQWRLLLAYNCPPSNGGAVHGGSGLTIRLKRPEANIFRRPPPLPQGMSKL